MEKHIPYEKVRNRLCDFIVNYKFYSEKEDGRKTGTPIQGYRSDFMYAEDVVENRNEWKMWMIWPQFLDSNNNVMIDKAIRVAESGKAQMWILNEAFHETHKNRIKIGQKGFFMEGSNKVAECEVIEIVGLK